jgi:hypothetical protein
MSSHFPEEYVMSKSCQTLSIEFEERERHCREQLRERYLDRLSSRDMFDVYQLTSAQDWTLTDVQCAIDSLLRAKARELVVKWPLSSTPRRPASSLEDYINPQCRALGTGARRIRNNGEMRLDRANHA